ncbi:acetyltransferase [Pseudomonas sp. SA3-5]|uniref:Acetyltransferase n=1 Tax=Pseudomonas aestuarii TaxID=3018340 RepID=A0ABT4XJZ0_9PSED|nr:acetyltransferase [Pseudomonas aestuarii]MDA7088500.1 acetyltransferase [Pseudomonas aestuarii]
MSERTLVIIGAGGHGKAVAEAALLSGEWQQIAFVDDRWPALSETFGWPVVSDVAGVAALAIHAVGAIAAVGNNAVREQWVKAIRAAGLPLVTVVHPRACVSAAATIGTGTAIMALAMVGVDAVIGEGAIVNAHATVDHDASLGDFAHLGVGVQLAGGVKIGAWAWLQAGCSAGYRVVVADGVVCAPGTVLQADGLV